MSKTYFFLLLGLISSLINAQQVYNIPNNLKDSNRSIKDAFTITNQETKNLTLFIDDNKTFNAYVYDKAMNRLDELSSVGLPNRYDEILGYIQKENRTILFLKHRNNKEFGAIVYDFKSNETFLNVFPASLEISFPVVVLPVNEIALTFGLLTIFIPISEPVPCRTLRTPLGRPASMHSDEKYPAVHGVTSEGFAITVLPIASAGAIFQVNKYNGRFQGEIHPTKPKGFFNV